MPNLVAFPAQALRGECSLPGDKSLSHRMALLAGLAAGKSCICNFLYSGVTEAMLFALTAIGVEWELHENELTVWGKGLDGLRAPGLAIDCGNSATTMRLLAGALSAAGISAVLDGSPGLRRRPMGRIVEPLQLMGVRIEAMDGCAPLELWESPRPLKAINYSLPVSSAQVKSCLLLAALAANEPVTLREPGPSRDHTERLLQAMGVRVEKYTSSNAPQVVTRLFPIEGRTLKPLEVILPGDMSSAAFLIVAALVVPGSEIILRNVGLNPTRTGMVDALLSMGADIRVIRRAVDPGEPFGDLLVRSSNLIGTKVSGTLVVRMIDEFPAFAVAAAFAKGETIIMQAEELHNKESDRITAMCQELSRLGINIRENPDGFVVIGGTRPLGGNVNAHKDHRLAMALSLVGLAGDEPVRVEGAEVIGESFPAFASLLEALGARLATEA